jgi:DNA-3-methyladenine glycosylase I
MTDAHARCAWAQSDALLRDYHDQEWGVPEHDSRALWEKLILDGFQAGLSWRTILARREGFRRAFEGFDPERVARLGPADVDRLMGDPGIIRARAKIEATIGNARAYLAMRDAGEDFAAFCWQFVGGSPLQWDGPVPPKDERSERFAKALRRKGFAFVGPTIVFAWMEACGLLNTHAPTCFRRGEVQKIQFRNKG